MAQNPFDLKHKLNKEQLEEIRAAEQIKADITTVEESSATTAVIEEAGSSSPISPITTSSETVRAEVTSDILPEEEEKKEEALLPPVAEELRVEAIPSETEKASTDRNPGAAMTTPGARLEISDELPRYRPERAKEFDNPFDMVPKASDESIAAARSRPKARIKKPNSKVPNSAAEPSDSPEKRTEKPASQAITDSPPGQDAEPSTLEDGENASSAGLSTSPASSALEEDATAGDRRVTEVFSGSDIEKLIVTNDNIKSAPNKLILFWILLLVSLIGSMFIYLERSLIANLFKSINNHNLLDLMFRKRNSNTNIVYSALYVLFFLNAGVFIYLSLQHYIKLPGYLYLVYAIAGVTGIYLLKHFVLLALGWVFPLERMMKSYSFSIIVFNVVGGLLLLPINFFMAFGQADLAKWSMIAGFGIFILFYILRNLRNTLMAWPIASRSGFHFMLYLCTVELMPLAVLWKAVS